MPFSLKSANHHAVTQDSMERIKDLLLIALVAGPIFFFNLGSSKLWDRDEPRNAGCAREMMERGNYITPIFNDELRGAKPVLLYWLTISAYSLFGVSEFSARFWSAALALGTVVCTYWIASRLFGYSKGSDEPDRISKRGRRIGIVSAVVLSTSFMFDVAARAATPDSLLIFFNTASLALFATYSFPRHEKAGGNLLRSGGGFTLSSGPAICMYALMAMGVLAKGPIGFLMPTAIIGMYLLIVTLEPLPVTGSEGGRASRWMKRIGNWMRPFSPLHFLRTCWSMRLITASVVVLLIAGPWYLLVGLQTEGDFLRTFFFKEHWGRSTTSFENHTGNVFYYPLVMAIGFFPWSVFALPVMMFLYRFRENLRPEIVFLLCWAGVQVGVFTIVQTKLPSYVTPCYPALAMIVAYSLCSWSSGELAIREWVPRISFGTLCLSGLAGAIGIGWATTKLVPVGPWISLVGLVPLAGGAAAGYCWREHRAWKERSLQILMGTAVSFSLLFFGVVLPRVSSNQQYEQLLVHVKSDDRTPIGSFGCLEPSWVFYGNRPVYELVERNAGGTPPGSRTRNWKPKARLPLKSFMIQQGGCVITLAEWIPKIETAIGQPVEIVQRTPYFMKDDELVLVRTQPAFAQSPPASQWK